MAFKEDRIEVIKVNGERYKVHKKIIADGTVWEKEYREGGRVVFNKGDKYKAEKGMEIKGVCIHNTGELGTGRDARQYALATHNQNMGTARVHYYVDGEEIWQLLEDNEIGWHAGDGIGEGNSNYIGIEIIGDNRKAEYLGIRLAAYLINKYNLDIREDKVIRKHQDFSGKYCPSYILNRGEWHMIKNKIQAVAMLDKDKKSEVKEYSIEESVEILEKLGIIDSPEYWKKSVSYIKNIDKLLSKVVRYIEEQ